jgi:hypothetical protein
MVWLGWFFRRVRQGLRHRLEGVQTTEWRYVHVGAVSGCVAAFVHACFDFNWQIPSNAAYFVVLAALATTTPLVEQPIASLPED